MTSFARFLATFGYSGYAPVAPGTAGSAAALLVYAALRWAGQGDAALAGVAVSLFLGGVWAAGVVARDVGREDPGIVVVDEAVGMIITLATLPVSVLGAVLGFLLFRVFDIVKPFPAAQSERLPGGLGIMMDDVFAGLYAHLCLRLAAWWLPAWLVAP